MADQELIFDYQHFGGNCPQCDSRNTALWMREIEVPDGYNDWQEWLSCHDCKHTWTETQDAMNHTYLLNNGYTEETINSAVENIKRKVMELLNKNKGAS